jgi:hypothetical protein
MSYEEAPEYEPDPMQCENKCGKWIDAGRADIIDGRDPSLNLTGALANVKHWNLSVCRDCYHDITGSPGEHEPQEQLERGA